MNKDGMIGEGILTIYRLVVITFIAFIILGVSSVFYDHVIDVRDAEAVIMTRSIVDCVAPKGVVDLDVVSGGILFYCDFDDDEVERFYVEVNVNDSGGRIFKFFQGDSGALWVLDIFNDVDLIEEGMAKYQPGYSKRVYDVVVLRDGVSGLGKIEVEVLVRDEV